MIIWLWGTAGNVGSCLVQLNSNLRLNLLASNIFWFSKVGHEEQGYLTSNLGDLSDLSHQFSGGFRRCCLGEGPISHVSILGQ